jgi:hypothetical protein
MNENSSRYIKLEVSPLPFLAAFSDEVGGETALIKLDESPKPKDVRLFLSFLLAAFFKYDGSILYKVLTLSTFNLESTNSLLKNSILLFVVPNNIKYKYTARIDIVFPCCLGNIINKEISFNIAQVAAKLPK